MELKNRLIEIKKEYNKTKDKDKAVFALHTLRGELCISLNEFKKLVDDTCKTESVSDAENKSDAENTSKHLKES